MRVLGPATLADLWKGGDLSRRASMLMYAIFEYVSGNGGDILVGSILQRQTKSFDQGLYGRDDHLMPMSRVR